LRWDHVVLGRERQQVVCDVASIVIAEPSECSHRAGWHRWAQWLFVLVDALLDGVDDVSAASSQFLRLNFWLNVG